MPLKPLIFITGITGFLGGALAARLLTGGHSLVALVRASSAFEARRRVARSLSRFVESAASERAAASVEIIVGDLTADPTYEHAGLNRITHVVHAAAHTSFASTRRAWQTNVEGTERLAARMLLAPHLRRFLHVSTAYCCGDRPNAIVREEDGPRAEYRHVNEYARSKATAELLLGSMRWSDRLVVARPSVVIGHTELGVRPSTSLFWYYRAMAALARGPFELEDRRDVIPVDYAAGALAFLLTAGQLQHAIYHISAGETSSASLHEVLSRLGLDAGESVATWRKTSASALAAMHGEVRALVQDDAEAAKLARGLGACARFGELGVQWFDNSRLISEGLRRLLPSSTTSKSVCRPAGTRRFMTRWSTMLDGLSCGERISATRFAVLKNRAVSEAFKWNITDHGTDTLCDFPLLLTEPLWQKLSGWAVLLAREAEAAEAELLQRPFLSASLGVPWRLQAALRQCAQRRSLRYSRFDFHPTMQGGFAITEGNLDVAGGWNEAGGVTALLAEHVGGAAPIGDPGCVLGHGIKERIGANCTVGIMHLTQYADDHQVARFLARTLEQYGVRTVFFDPTQLRRAGNRAGALIGDRIAPLDAVFRFFPAEWSCRLESPREWFGALEMCETLWINPLSTVLVQSKRFPLCWPFLKTPIPTWSRLMPETRSPLVVGGKANWVVKPALGHEGYRVGVAGATPAAGLRSLWWQARLRPWRWAAQRRFRAASIATPHGPRFPCIGVYVVDCKPAGLYGRLSEQPLVDAEAQDVVVLVRS